MIGLALICCGLWIRTDPEFRRYVNVDDNFNFLWAGAYVIVCIGVVVVVVAALGCFGAVKSNVCIIITVSLTCNTSWCCGSATDRAAPS